MASWVQRSALSSQQYGCGSAYSGQITLDSSGGNGDKSVAYFSSWKRSHSLRLSYTHFEGQASSAHRVCLKIQAVTETLQQGEMSLVDSPAGKLNVVLQTAKTEDKLRAAATLRARSFYLYPEERSRDALLMHQKMKAEDEWAILTRKVGGMEPGYKRTTCLIAFCPTSELLDISTDLMHSHCKITSSPAEDCIVIGTLDINQGLLLPGELTGEYPQGPDAEYRRAYLSNVCVAKEVRRRGVGMILMQHAKKTAKLWGLSDLYVHVVVDNVSARQLYERAGFVYEKEETVKEARSNCRPRRYLLRAQL